jgi:predicted transcriptional regulator
MLLHGTATSVKMDDDAKARLERLRAEIRLKTGTRVTQQELLARLVEHAIESKADLVDSFHAERVPLDDAEREAFHEGMVSSGATTSEEDIDDVLYG